MQALFSQMIARYLTGVATLHAHPCQDVTTMHARTSYGTGSPEHGNSLELLD